MEVRRVVTGHDTNDKSVIVSDEVVEPVRAPIVPGYEFFELWATSGPRHIPTAVGEPAVPEFFPGPEGSVLRIWTIPPSHSVDLGDIDFEEALAQAAELLPGMIDHMEPDEPGMHTTDTVDYDIILAGEVVMELDDGAEVTLGPGSCVVQNGTRHRWHNRSDGAASMVSVLLGATRAT